ncbi:DUF4124 domain-containing protein [Rhodoferax saidenbachensis]|uniref:DUF4124 domain-containing protein n=1 Tax=Rhodoferax saidenbachensis TaxID=1484693 RepID=A0ABU1ZQN8_9BURK|nr:DUF4124 domain-containing protein [Rhodoferax saidenbachensis]MDR7307698.1 hypothetical protein [Rhodoferax saidenbachensis]
MRLQIIPQYFGLSLALLFIAFSGFAQGVYKWVDAEGKIHYGAQPPANEKTSEPLKLHSNSGFGGDNNGKVRATEYNADGTKKIPQDVQDFAKGMEKALKKADPKDVPLDCISAVKNAQDQADTALEVSAKNMKDGYITQADYENNAAKIRRAKAETTLASCQFATGKDRAFYQCMSNGNNHFLACTK